MRAVVVRTYGGSEALEVVDVPAPNPGVDRSGSGSKPRRLIPSTSRHGKGS
jgi:hypothetical protein